MSVTDFVLAKLSEAPKLAEDYTTEDGKDLPKRRIYSYLRKKTDEHLESEDGSMVILTGLRGVGKTTVLFQLYKYLLNKKDIDRENLLYVSMDEATSFVDTDLSEIIRTYTEEVHNTSLVGLDDKVFIFVDEAHFDEKWSETAKVIYDKSSKVFMVLTGSSALDLSINTDTARRADENTMFPLTFPEYLILKYSIYPPQGAAKQIRDSVLENGTSIENLKEVESGIRKRLTKVSRPSHLEFKNFVYYGGFAYGLSMSEEEVLERTRQVIERVVHKDLMKLGSFNQRTLNRINKVLSFLALQKPGGTSHANLADRLDVSPNLISKIIDSLCDSQLIFKVVPYGGAGKTVKKPWKYYFLTPTLKATICHILGKFNSSDKTKYGEYLEQTVASVLYRNSKIVNRPQGIYYDAKDGGADFIIKNGDKYVPIEVGSKNKGTDQVKKSMRRVDAERGILVTSSGKVEMREDVLHIPIEVFSFM